MLKTLWKHFRTLDIFLDKHALGLFLCLLVFILRIPTFAEPYWYGDEAIYLTIGNALRAGERMYVDVIDHKTPLIYYFAAFAGDQFGFRLLTLAAVVLSTAFFFFLTKDFFSRIRYRTLATLIFILYTNIPRYEGNIPNGELFVMTFVLGALVLLRHTSIYQSFFTKAKHVTLPNIIRKQSGNTVFLFSSGVLFGLATLTKVPAVFDFAAVFALGWFLAIDEVFPSGSIAKRWTQKLYSIVLQLGLVLSGWGAAIFASIVYHALRGSLSEYIDFGLLYNFRYAGSWSPQFPSPVVAVFFSLPGKLFILTAWTLLLTLLRKHLTPQFRFAAVWLLLTLVAATLSNRPYPHYFLQVFPALSIVVAQVFEVLFECLSAGAKMLRSQAWKWEKQVTSHITQVALSFIVVAIFMTTLELLQVTPYPTTKYYRLFYQFATKQISWPEYRDQFNPLLRDNYQISKLLRMNPEEEIFIWGDNPLLYALSGKNPVGRFTVAFHIDDFNAYQETLDVVQTKSPKYIIVMKHRTMLQGLEPYLNANYIPSGEYDTLTVWRRTNH